MREPQLLFRKIEDEEVAAQVEKLQAGTKKSEVGSQESGVGSQESGVGSQQPTVSVNSQPSTDLKPDLSAEALAKAEIVFDDFGKIDLKVGTIISAEKVVKADKLLKLEIDLGFETRTIVSGIALHYQPEAIVGKQVVVVVNLAPRKMKGVESRGMILMAEDSAGKLHFVSPAEMINPGAGVS
jgi:methionyl-tRNA synthetase